MRPQRVRVLINSGRLHPGQILKFVCRSEDQKFICATDGQDEYWLRESEWQEEA